MSDSEDLIEPIEETDEGGDDLFGDDEPASPPARILDDDELASDGHEGSYARDHDHDDDEDQRQEVRDRIVMAVTAYRHRVPKPTDGALRVLRVPQFVKFHPAVYDREAFQPSEFDMANATAEAPQHVARVQRDAKTDKLTSNTNVFQWSDGSVTISVGGEHYELQRKPLAPEPGQPYAELRDGHYYAAAAELTSNALITVGHVTEQYTVRPNANVVDDALTVLAERMAEATKAKRPTGMIIRTTKDPELQKKQAEAAEKERMKAQRRRENAAAKMDSGLGRPSRGGLSIGDLEGGRRAEGGARKRGPGGSGKGKRRRPEYDSDDDLPQGVGRHEEYDLDDGFLVGSDEEDEESAEESEDEEEMLDDDEAPRSKRQRTEEGSDEDAEGEEVEPATELSARARKRNVLDDDDE